MAGVNYKYDVAFSFLAQDESLAFELHSLLKFRVNSFIYSEHQKELAGGDGEKLFNQVFGTDSRVVVVLYRNNWGQSTWTRIEETAVRNRGFKHGYDFVLFIPLDSPVNIPEWLPKNRLWIGIERWGIEHAASIIEARIQERDGEIKEETIADKALMAQEEIKAQKEREALLYSSKPELMRKEFLKLIDLFEKSVTEIKEKLPDWRISTRKNSHEGIEIISYGFQLTIQNYSSYIFISFWDGTFDEYETKTDLFRDYKQYGMDRITFDIDINNQHGWSENETGKNFRTSLKVKDDWFGSFIDKISAARKKGGY